MPVQTPGGLVVIADGCRPAEASISSRSIVVFPAARTTEHGAMAGQLAQTQVYALVADV